MRQTIGRRPAGLDDGVKIYRTAKDDRKELSLQIECSGWINYEHPELLYWHNRQEGKNSKSWHATGAKCGVKKGVPDLIICTDRVGYFELKTKSTPSNEQKEFLSRVARLGHFACLVYSFKDFKKAVEEFLAGS